MKNPTYEEVVEAGKEVVLNTSTVEPFGFVFIALGIILLTDLIYKWITQQKNEERKLYKKRTVLAVALIALPFWTNQGPTEAEKIEFASEQAEWKEEFAIPYISKTLPTTVVKNIEQIEKSTTLEKQGKSYYAVIPTNGRVLPIELTTETGETYRMWMDVIISEEGNQRLTYTKLNKMINVGVEQNGQYVNKEQKYGKNYPAGNYNTKLYVDQKTYDTIIK